MGYLDKMHRKAEIEKKVKEVMNHPKFKKYKQQVEEEAFERAFDTFLLLSGDYLYRNFGCKKAGILKYLAFITTQMGYISEDPDYYVLLNKELAKETGVNILENRLEEHRQEEEQK